jgi:hypothetical protein
VARPPAATPPRQEFTPRGRYDAQGLADGVQEAPPELSQGQKVTVAALALIAASLVWKGVFLSHFNFRQDDFWLMDSAARYGLKWQYIGRVWSGQFLPGGYVIGWLLVKISVYNWTLSVAAELAAIAVASLAAWRLCRTLLGNRPAILIPLALYVLSSLTFEAASWWISAVETIPLQIAIFTSLDAHIRYVRTRRFRHAVIAAAWLAFGLCCYEKAAVIPLLLFAVTAGFLVSRRSLLVAIRDTVVRFWRAWAIYLAVLGCYLAVFFARLSGSGVNASAPKSAHNALTFSWNLFFHSFAPGLLGGPWEWTMGSPVAGGGAAPPPELAWLAILVVAAIAVGSILTRWRAWRGWAILLGWFAVADILPVLIGRVTSPGWAVVLGGATRYVADAPAVLAVVVALIFWPVAGLAATDQESTGRRREFFSSAGWREAAIALVAVFAIGSFWTADQYQTHSPVTSGSYIANARYALGHIPAGTVVVDLPVPDAVMIPAYGPDSDTSVVLGPVTTPGHRIIWTSQPAANLAGVMIFGPDGRLEPASAAAVQGASWRTASAYANCLKPHQLRMVVPLSPPQPSGVLRLDYLASSPALGESVNVSYNGITGTIPITSEGGHVDMMVSGTASEVTLQARLSAGADFCLVDAVAGYFNPNG